MFGDTWGEHPDLDKLCALQERLDELHNDTERAAYTAFCDHEGLDDVTVEQFHEAYVGQFDSWADFAENIKNPMSATARAAILRGRGEAGE